MRTWDDLTKRGLLSLTPTKRVDDQEYLRMGRRDWQVVHTPGHTGDHICLLDPENGILLSGDHVLPTITPHISGLTPSPDSLAEFVEGLRKVAAIPDVSLVLPAHGLPFTDLAGPDRRHHRAPQRAAAAARWTSAGELGLATVGAVLPEAVPGALLGADGGVRDLRPPRAPAHDRRHGRSDGRGRTAPVPGLGNRRNRLNHRGIGGVTGPGRQYSMFVVYSLDPVRGPVVFSQDPMTPHRPMEHQRSDR